MMESLPRHAHVPGSLLSLVEGLAFWAAVLVALSYPVLFLAIDQGLLDPLRFSFVVVGHVIALALGHRYGAPDRRA